MKDWKFVKIGNESIGKQEWSMFEGLKKDAEKEIGNETYQHKLYPDKYVIIDGKNYKIITDGKVEKTGELTDAVLYGINQTYKRVSSMNSKTGNEAPEEMEVKYKGYTITYFPYQKKYMVRHPNEVSGLVQKHFTSVDEAKKAIDKKAIGNEETKAERKFGKVMGEFEEGSLKTPQGKTVTDPKQAKAIAYSEADKVDNLKRARNSIKTGNASFYTTKYASNPGKYEQTDLDLKKMNADFRIIDSSGKKNTIVWKSGRQETISDVDLEKLKKQHPNWVTDF